MNDVIRVDLTPEEASHLAALFTNEVKPDTSCGVCKPIAAKLHKAQQNPLNGPTFDFAKHSDVEIPEEHGGEA